jgi:hypothetical protein
VCSPFGIPVKSRFRKRAKAGLVDPGPQGWRVHDGRQFLLASTALLGYCARSGP